MSLIAVHLERHATRHAVLMHNDAIQSVAVTESVETLARLIRAEGIREAAALIASGTLEKGRITIELDAQAVALATKLPADDLAPEMLIIDQPFTCRRRGVELKIVAGNMAAAQTPR